MAKTRFLLVLASPLLTAGIAQQAFPVAITEGPLVCLSTHDRGKPHVVTMHLAARDGDTKAERFWQNRGNVDVQARLDRDHLLISSYGEPYALIVVNVAAGSHRVLAAGSPHAFVARHGDEVLFLGDNRWQKGDNFLYAAPWRQAGERRKLGSVRFGQVPIVAGNLAIAITADQTEVHAVSVLRGTSKKLLAVDEHAFRIRLAQSPGGQRLAVGVVGRNGRGVLTVVDIGAGLVLRTWRDLRVEVSPLSSSTPALEVAWFDDEHVVSSETRGQAFRGGSFVHVRRRIDSGEVVDEAIYSDVVLNHSPKSATDATEIPPTFSMTRRDGRSCLLQAGIAEPLASFANTTLRGGDIQLAPDAHSAIARLGKARQRCTLFRSSRPPLLLLERWAYDYQWLPAASSGR